MQKYVCLEAKELPTIDAPFLDGPKCYCRQYLVHVPLLAVSSCKFKEAKKDLVIRYDLGPGASNFSDTKSRFCPIWMITPKNSAKPTAGVSQKEAPLMQTLIYIIIWHDGKISDDEMDNYITRNCRIT